jgi:3-isopropylmalate/(R)-2-methylmalate dehydratase small subunit
VSDDFRICTIEGSALPLAGDDIDTDRIIPARYLRAISFDGLEQHVFEDDRSAALTAGRTASAAHPFDDPRFAGARVLVVHRNFGCGSSREHAPQALYRWGIRAIVGESFSDIFFGNALMMGLPCVTAARGDLDTLMRLVDAEPKTPVRVSLETLDCVAGDFTCAIHLAVHTRDAFITGAWDTTGMLLDRYDEVRQVASRLPYIGGFRTPPAA